MHESLTLSIRVRGPLACFTRPELKVERVSYPVMTPSAARGVLEAVLWKPAIVWQVKKISVLKDINYLTFRRNEVNRKVSSPSEAIIKHGGEVRPFYADDPSNRAQRNTVALRDVDYVIEASFRLTERAGPDDNPNKFVEMFRRRVEKGQYFHHPYLGCREFAAEVLPSQGAPNSIRDSRDLGMMLLDITFGNQGNRPLFFAAKLQEGVLQVPDIPPIGGAV